MLEPLWPKYSEKQPSPFPHGALVQGNLGEMYAQGQGVMRDNVYAHMWANLAASNGLGAMGRGSRCSLSNIPGKSSSTP